MVTLLGTQKTFTHCILNIGLIAAGILANITAKAQSTEFSSDLKNKYIDAFYNARLEAEGTKAELKSTAKELCSDLKTLVKDSKDIAQDIKKIETELCKQAAEAKGLRCTGGGLTGPGAARALLRSELNSLCFKK